MKLRRRRGSGLASGASLHDDSSIASDPSEPEVPGIPTLDMTTLDILEHALFVVFKFVWNWGALYTTGVVA
jgi:hypothetical protein